MMKENQISFCWYYPKINKTTCTAYCYAYIRDRNTGDSLYAGVKYEGDKSRLKHFKPCLRKTAIERLINKPIYAQTPSGKMLIELLEHKDRKINGATGQDLNKEIRNPKISTVLAKFFTNSSLICKIKICASKNSGLVLDKNFNVIRNIWNEKYSVLDNKDYIYIDIGCYYNDGYHIINPRNGDGIVRAGINIILEKIKELYNNAYFAGKDKNRAALRDYQEQTNHYLSQFGISRTNPHEKPRGLWMNDLEYDSRVRYCRIKLSNNYVLHLGIMKYNNWKKFIDSFSQQHYYEIDSYNYHEVIVYSRYFQKITGDVNEDKFESLRGRKIIYNKMIFRPVFLEINRLLLQNIKEIQDYLVKNINELPKEGKYLYFGDKIQELDLYYEINNGFITKSSLDKININTYPLSIFYYFRDLINQFKIKFY